LTALDNVALSFVLSLAEEGARRAPGEDVHRRNVHEGHVTHRAVALEYVPAEQVLRL
jgi:hypothetical protein